MVLGCCITYASENQIDPRGFKESINILPLSTPLGVELENPLLCGYLFFEGRQRVNFMFLGLGVQKVSLVYRAYEGWFQVRLGQKVSKSCLVYRTHEGWFQSFVWVLYVNKNQQVIGVKVLKFRKKNMFYILQSLWGRIKKKILFKSFLTLLKKMPIKGCLIVSTSVSRSTLT